VNTNPPLRNDASSPINFSNAAYRLRNDHGNATSAKSSPQLGRRILPARSVRATRILLEGSQQQEVDLETESHIDKRKEATGVQQNHLTSYKRYSDSEVETTKRPCRGFGPPAHVFSIDAFPSMRPAAFKIDRKNRRQLILGAATCAVEVSKTTVKLDDIVEPIRHKFIAAPVEFDLKD